MDIPKRNGVATCRKSYLHSRCRAGHRKQGRKALGVWLIVSIALIPQWASGFEADVHYGLTRWLAEKAGFDVSEAESIALGDQRVDGGLIENMKSQLQYACLCPYEEDARAVQELHYPSQQLVPSEAAKREVIPGGRPSSSLAERLLADARGKSGFMLQLFGRSLHPLQDSFAHQGVPAGLSSLTAGIRCDARFTMGAALERQHRSYHDAEVTRNWQQDVLGMARATYDLLQRYPAVDGKSRSPAPWSIVAAQIEGFAEGASKAEKAAWFKARGITDVSFLDGISLPDGIGWTPVRWKGRKLPDFTAAVSAQSGIDPDVLDFYNRFLVTWLVGDRKVGQLAQYLKHDGQRSHAPSVSSLELKLWLWRLRDHGAAIPLLFGDAGDRTQDATALALVRRRGNFARYSVLSDAVLPIMIESDRPSPLLPFIVFQLRKDEVEPRRAVAILKLLDAPYETVGVLAEKREGEWRITSLLSTYDY